jgi:hypothetical protein
MPYMHTKNRFHWIFGFFIVFNSARGILFFL